MSQSAEDSQIHEGLSLDQRIDLILGSGGRMFLATSCGGISSGATVFYARDGDDLIFFTFNPTRKAEQIRQNPRVQAAIWPENQQGIRGLQIEGRCQQITSSEEVDAAKQAVLLVTTAFEAYMNDEFLTDNKVTGYYRLRPTAIKYVDFHATQQFEWKRFPQNEIGSLRDMTTSIISQLLLWLRALRAPFFTATIVPVLLGTAIAANHVATTGGLDWQLFWLVLVGAIAAHAGTNLANDFGDHKTGNDEANLTPSPFNGGSRVIQAGLLPPWKVLLGAVISFAICILCGLHINQNIGGSWFAPTPLLWIGLAGTMLGIGYSLGPFRLSYKGFGELAIALGFGPVMVLGSHYVLTAHLDDWHWLEPLLASIPVGLLVMLIVWINQFQDVPADRKTGKQNWVVRLAGSQEKFDYRKPFALFKAVLIAAFGCVLVLGLLPSISVADRSLGTVWALIALLPAALLYIIFTRGDAWLDQIDQQQVNWQKHPYLLLPVNVTTIGIHLLTGLLLVLAWWIKL